MTYIYILSLLTSKLDILFMSTLTSNSTSVLFLTLPVNDCNYVLYLRNLGHHYPLVKSFNIYPLKICLFVKKLLSSPLAPLRRPKRLDPAMPLRWG